MLTGNAFTPQIVAALRMLYLLGALDADGALSKLGLIFRLFFVFFVTLKPRVE